MPPRRCHHALTGVSPQSSHCARSDRPRRLGLRLVCSAAALVALVATALAQAQDPIPKSDPSSANSDGNPAGNAANSADSATKSDPNAKTEPQFVWKTDEQWRRILTYEQFVVTRLKGTEPAFSGRYSKGHYRGTFLCVCCGAELFDARHKFESGTGWPSFWRPINANAVGYAVDNSDGEPRTEVMCRRCGAHLGHVFDDGPPPTGQRYCMNSVALKLKPLGGVMTNQAATSKSRTKAKAKAKAKAKSTPKAKIQNASQAKKSAANAPSPTGAPADPNPSGQPEKAPSTTSDRP